MAGRDSVVSVDLVEASLSGPIDWARLESLVHAVLVNDDLPDLSKIGGGGDYGIDAESVFYDVLNRTRRTVVQVSSTAAQRQKVKDTITKLRAHSVPFVKLIYVTNIPVGAETRRSISALADELDLDVEVRDQSYLVAQLSKTGSPIFSRFFASIEKQRDVLFGHSDALQLAPDNLQHALLATLGAFVLSPHARVARKTLFDNTVLAAISSRDGSDVDQLIADVQKLCPGEDVYAERVRRAIRRLEKAGSCESHGELVRCSKEVVQRFVAVAGASKLGFSQFVKHVTLACKKVQSLSQGQEGFLERNLRQLVLRLLRISGPVAFKNDGLANALNRQGNEDLKLILGKNLPPELVKTAMAAVAGFVGSPAGASALAPLVRSYGALAIRNLDPLGKGWQQSVLSRNTLALDTDVVLAVLIKELPEHGAVLAALNALSGESVKLVLPDHIKDEVIDHVGRADRTFVYFRNQLLRMPVEAVNDRVGNAVVRGYYHASKGKGVVSDFNDYWRRYWNAESSQSYIENVLSRRLALHIEDLASIRPEVSEIAEQLALKAVELKESMRKKALYRDEWSQAARVRLDVCMAVNASERVDTAVGGNVRAYVVSSDGLFRFLERQEEWKGRTTVSLATLALPQLVSFVAGTTLDDLSAVDFLFHDLTVLAASEMSEEIEALAAIGVDLSEVDLDQLEWDLRGSLRDSLADLEAAVSSEDEDAPHKSSQVAMRTLEVAHSAGYSFAKPVQAIIDDHARTQAEMVETLAVTDRQRDQLSQFLDQALSSSPAKTRARLRRIAKDLGLD
ncbi:hypothetical protein [Stenotrophomonas sp. PFBMAA-4]|uniref:hypothetical protein n=1 Tax=Stenotrophomonas sp. PFBMAA-4 TaxID=3043301 RepID=UPI0024B4FDEE|nr:hypothetical protein [Stenotrophomonas sp. PFBMAA-4]MDI9272283.1 hypothetical protein [Stenotrophomonas sp. PFBMAA-4]